MKIGPKGNSSSVKNALRKLVLLQNLLGKFFRKFSVRIYFGKTMISADILQPLLPAFFEFQLNQYSKLTDYFLHLRLT